MSRQGTAEEKTAKSDPIYRNRLVNMLVNRILKHGKKIIGLSNYLSSREKDSTKNRNKSTICFTSSNTTLIDRVLADDIYMRIRCIATQNQDIGIGLSNRFITFQAQPIYIRTPFTCRNTSWICQLCYGRSPTCDDLVELGEAVGIIAGQSIGEPGTQLTLRTFHTGGVFTGGTAEHVRAPCNGKIRFNEDVVHPHITVMDNPLFYVLIDLYVTVESRDIIHNVNIPPKSLFLVQNDQYVESEQIIAEIRAGTSTFYFKEKVRKHIYSESEG